MVKRITVVGSVALLLLGVAFYAVFGPKATSSDKQVTIGVVLPLTGELGNFGKSVLNGVNLAVEDFRGRNPDIQIRIIPEDSKGQPAAAVSAFQKLRDVDGAHVIIGSLTSSETLAMAPVADRTKTLLVSPTASSPALSKAGPYFFRVWTSDTYDGRIAAQFAREDLKLQRVGIIYLNNDYGLGLKEVFQETFTHLGGEAAASEGYLASETDFRSVLTKLKQLKLDGLYLPGQPEGIARCLKQAKELGIQTTILSCVAAEDQQFVKLAGSAAYGVFYTAPAFDVKSDRAEVQCFVKKYRDSHDTDPDTHAVHGYDAAAVILSGVATGIRTSDALQHYLRTTASFSGLTGDFHFNSNGDVVTAVAIKQYDPAGGVRLLRVVSPNVP